MIDFKIDIFAKGEGFATHIFSCFGVCIKLNKHVEDKRNRIE